MHPSIAGPAALVLALSAAPGASASSGSTTCARSSSSPNGRSTPIGSEAISTPISPLDSSMRALRRGSSGETGPSPALLQAWRSPPMRSKRSCANGVGSCVRRSCAAKQTAPPCLIDSLRQAIPLAWAVKDQQVVTRTQKTARIMLLCAYSQRQYRLNCLWSLGLASAGPSEGVPGHAWRARWLAARTVVSLS